MRKNNKTNLLRRVLLILSVCALLLTGCNQTLDNTETNGNDITGDIQNQTPREKQPLEYGFKIDNNGENDTSCVSAPVRFAYRCEDNYFDIDNVTVEFAYGNAGKNDECSAFEVYFTTWTGIKFPIKRVEEDYSSEKYDIHFSGICDEEGTLLYSQVEFNHTEFITVPKEVFRLDEGYFYFCIDKINEQIRTGEYSHLDSILVYERIYYKKVDGKVVLSHWEHFDDKDLTF